MTENEIIEGLKTVCQCKAIKKKMIRQHITAGAATLEKIQALTGAGAGECQGKRCTAKILELLQHKK